MLLTLDQLRILLDVRAEFLMASVPEFKGKNAAFKRAYYKNANRIAADMPRSPCGAISTMLALGVSPPMNGVLKRVGEIGLRGMHRAEEAAQMRGPNASEEYTTWLSGAYTCKQLEQMSALPQDSLKGLGGVPPLKTSPQVAPLLHELSQGRHTVDMLPPKEMTDDDGEGSTYVDAEAGEPDGGGGTEGGNAPPAPPVHEG
jgi:hypothetical protein